jgi:hypothetical protein
LSIDESTDLSHAHYAVFLNRHGVVLVWWFALLHRHAETYGNICAYTAALQAFSFARANKTLENFFPHVKSDGFQRPRQNILFACDGSRQHCAISNYLRMVRFGLAVSAFTGDDRTGITAVVEAFRAPGRNFFTTNPPGPLDDNTEIDISHEALIRHWQQLSDPTRDPRRNEPVGWLWREFEDGRLWRALAVQARVFRDDKSKSAVLTPATTEHYEPWWPEHTSAWAARYASDKGSAFEEYQEVEALWPASEKALDLERIRVKREMQAANDQVAPPNDQVALLRQGVSAWNQWRIKNSGATSDLREVDLAGAGVNLDGLPHRREPCQGKPSLDKPQRDGSY